MTNISTNQTEVARFAGALYGLVLDNATMTDVVSAVNSSGLNTVLNNVFMSDFGSASDASVAATLTTNLGLTGTAATEGQAYIVGVLGGTAANAKGAAIMTILNQFAGLTGDATFGTAATAWEGKVSNSVAYAQNTANTSNGSISNISSTPPGQTISLTTSIDTFNGGTTGNNTINSVAVSGANTLTSLDTINGGTGGGNTLNFVDGVTAVGAAYALPGSVTVSNIATANLTTNGSFGDQSVPTVFDLSAWGVGTFNLVAGGTKASDVKVSDTTALNLTDAATGAVVTTVGGTAIAITNSAVGATTNVGGGALTTVSVTGGGNAVVSNDAATGTTDGAGTTLTSVTFNGITGTADSVATKSTTLGLTLENLKTTGATVTVTDAALKTLNLTTNAVGYTSAGAALAAVPVVLNTAATSVNVNATGKTNLELTTAAATSLGVSGAGAVTIKTASTFGTLTAINASSNSGGLTMTDGAAGAVLTGGSGNDVITLTAALTSTSGGSINLGAGNNTLLAGSGGSVGSGVSVDGGTGGTNTISATLVNAGSAATIKDFQILDVSGFGNGAGNGALDTALMPTSISGVSITSAATSGTATLLNLGANVTVTDSADNTSSALVLTHSAGAGTLTIDYASSAATTAGATIISSLTSTGDTAVTISSLGTDTTTPAANTLTTLIETDNHLATVTITGANPFTLGGVHTDSTLATGTATVASSLTTIDASATTGGVTITAGGSDTVNGNTITYTGLTIKGGTGGDTITNNAASGVITEGATASTAVNHLTLGATATSGTINDGSSAGTDVLTVSGANDTATLGSGASTVTVSANAATSDIVTVNLVSGAGATVTDHLLYGSAAGNQTASTTYDLLVLGGATHGNTVAFSAAIATAPGALGTATSVASAQTFDQAVFVALGGTMGGSASTTTTQAVNTVDWFQYGGNTYIVDAGTTAPGAGAAATAEVVKIAGAVDLSHATINTLGAGITFA
jgi:S-layer protein